MSSARVLPFSCYEKNFALCTLGSFSRVGARDGSSDVARSVISPALMNTVYATLY